MSKTIGIPLLGVVTFLLAASLGFADPIDIDTSSPFLSAADTKTISMDFQEAALDDILKIFSQQTGINFITSENVANRRITVYLDRVPVEKALEQLLRANGLTYEVQPGSNIYVVKPWVQPNLETITRIYPLKHASVTNAQINKTVSIEGVEMSAGGLTETIKSILTGKGSFVEDPRTNSLIITDVASNFPKIENAIARLDVPLAQIMIEVEMLEVTKSTAEKVGNLIGDTPLVLKGTSRSSYFPFTAPAPITYGSSDDDSSSGGMGTVDFSGMTATLQFLRTQTGTKTLARPRVLTLNNQAAEIKISANEAIGSSQNQASGDNSTLTTQGAERTETGVFLKVTPQANLMTGEILMAVEPKFVVTRAGRVSINNEPVRDPEERSTKTILRVQNGDTLVIGGLLRQDVEKAESKVPVLGDIPFLGSLFRHRNESVSDKELIVFITPHILNETPVSQLGAIPLPTPPLQREQDIPVSSAVSTELEKMDIKQHSRTP